MIDDGTPIWCFAGPEMWALTDDETGQVLPADLGPWVLRKSMAMTGSDPDEAEALDLIREHGFCCFDPAPAEAAA